MLTDQQFTAAAHRVLPRPPSRHSYRRFLGRDHTVGVVLHAPRQSMTDGVEAWLRGEVADIDQQLHSYLLNDLGDELAERADGSALPPLHRILAARMSSVADHVAVPGRGERIPPSCSPSWFRGPSRCAQRQRQAVIGTGPPR